MIFKNNNQKYFFYHNILREFFYSIGKLGWAYLLLNGVNILAIITGLFFYRYFSSHQFLYFSRKYYIKLNYKIQLFLSIFVQSLFLISFYFATQNYFYFAITVFFSCLSEVFYWPIKDDIQRFCVKNQDMGTNVSLTKNAKTIAVIFGYLISGVGLSFNPLITLLIGAFGIILSYIPLIKISLENLKKVDTNFVNDFFSFKNKFKLLTRFPQIRNYCLLGGILELVNGLIPILIVYYGTSLIELGILLTILQIFGMIFHYFIGKFEDRGNSFFYKFSGFFLGFSFLLFAYLDNIYLSFLLAIFKLLGIAIDISITSKVQKIIGTQFHLADSGYVLVWASNLGRCLILPIILLIYFFKDLVNFHSVILLYAFVILLLIFFNFNFKNIK